MNKDAAIKYQTQQIMTASPAKLVAMLYDRAISLLKEAIGAIEAGDIERRWRANNKAVDIISHLAMTLDMEKGGQIAENLDQIYRFILARLGEIDIRNDPQIARDMIGLLEPLRQSWHQLAEGNVQMPSLGDKAAPAPTDAKPQTSDQDGRTGYGSAGAPAQRQISISA